jgi:hypothetical protein
MEHSKTLIKNPADLWTKEQMNIIYNGLMYGND